MKYMMLFAEPEHHILQRTSADAPAYCAAWGAFAKSMAESGLMIEGRGLQDKTTANRRARAEARRVGTLITFTTN